MDLDDDDIDSGTKLIIELTSGRNVTDATTRNTKSGPAVLDTQVILQLGDQKFKSAVSRHSANPIWQQSFTFDIEGLTDAAVILITCESVGSVWNSVLGEIRIPVINHSNVPIDYASVHWFPLHNPKLRKDQGSPGEIGMKIGINSRKMVTKYGGDLDDRAIDDIYSEARDLAKDSNDSAMRSLAMLKASREIGTTTLSKLRDQGRQIEMMQADMDTVHNNMDQANRKLRSIESVWGTMANVVTPSGNGRNKKKSMADRKAMAERKKGEKRESDARSGEWSKERSAIVSNSKRRGDAMIERPKGAARADMTDNEEQFYEYLDSTDRVLDQMDTLLDDLHFNANQIQTELKVHEKRIDIINRDIAKAAPRIDKAIGRCGTITQ